MPSNIEIKAVLADPDAARATAFRLSGSAPEIIRQTDVFFRCAGARLKLRILAPDSGELIRYERSDTAEARRSHYLVARTADPDTLLEILKESNETAGVVTKTRELYLVGRTRIHIDRVEGLGDFLELETVLEPGQTEAEGAAIADALFAEFGIAGDRRVAEAYVDLLARQAARALARSLREAVDRELPALRAIAEDSAAAPPGPGKWSPKEELGHLLDSAVNNRVRIVRAVLEGAFEGPGYEQNGWVRLGGYGELPWRELVEAWRLQNSLLAHLAERIPDERLEAKCAIGGGEPVTLRFVVEDYVRHMRHHLDRILGRAAAR